MSAAKGNPIVIVGAGVAGLIAAIDLQRAGRPVLLLDAAPTVGGRVRTTVHDGLVIDHGFQVLFTAYPTLRQYVDVSTLSLRRFLPAARIARDGKTSLIGDALANPALLLDTIFAGAIGLTDKLRLLALRRFAQRLSIDDCFGPRYATISTRDFLLARGFGPAVIDGFFAPFYGGILLDRTLATTASVLLFTFKMLAEGDTVIPAGGIGALTAQLASQLKPGTVHLNAPVASLVVADGRVTGVRQADGRVIDAAQVVLATDAPMAARLAATAGVTLPEPTGARGCTTLYYTARTSPIPGKALWLNAAPHAVISHAVTLTDVAPEYASHGRTLIAATAVGAPADLDDDTLDRAARAELAHMGNVSAEQSALDRVALWRVPYAQFEQAPGWREQGPGPACGIPGLWRASETLHSSSLEGAARGGQMAAAALLQVS
ncbi:FAD-dependent oxidoreductase [Gemmatimonas sp.]|jgi:phytoene dehydrogenase-like protein|uniref:FAD-dependent oxidoreductase n=1 Tax=Gemmatimonas sp. TaxID=1962908 RepID=UPI0037C19B8E